MIFITGKCLHYYSMLTQNFDEFYCQLLVSIWQISHINAPIEIVQCIFVMRLTLYLDEAYWMSQLASSYHNMTGLEMTFIVNVSVYTFTYDGVITGFVHMAPGDTPKYDSI